MHDIMGDMKTITKIIGQKLDYKQIDTDNAISVIIPTYNEQKYLPKLLKDLSEQNFEYGFEVIVVDKSEDKTADEAKKFSGY
jgi:cellulose synthase/poly-beta-1,6-N-acetylglucosamine synthase-like glycosyltransferase